jgi:hypothetical protein
VVVLDIALRVTEALERTGVGYFLGGSLASSFQGEPRATNDIDLVVDLEEGQVEGLAVEPGANFDVDEVALRRAAAEKSSWNAIYLPTATKSVRPAVARRGAGPPPVAVAHRPPLPRRVGR